MYSVPSSAFTTNTVFQKYCSISFKNKTIGCSKSRTSCNLIARWDVDLYGKPPTTLAEPYFPSSLFRPINLHYFAKVTFTISEQRKSTIIAIVSWYAPHPNQFTLGKPAEIWCSSIFEASGLHSFLPIDRLVGRCAHCSKTVNDENVLVIVPLV